MSGEITGKQTEASNVIRDVAKQNNSKIAYCGSSFISALEKNNKHEECFPDLLMDDNTHAGTLGNYVMSCSMYIALTGLSPVGLKFTGAEEISEEAAQKLQEIAWEEYINTSNSEVLDSGKLI